VQSTTVTDTVVSFVLFAQSTACAFKVYTPFGTTSTVREYDAEGEGEVDLDEATDEALLDTESKKQLQAADKLPETNPDVAKDLAEEAGPDADKAVEKAIKKSDQDVKSK